MAGLEGIEPAFPSPNSGQLGDFSFILVDWPMEPVEVFHHHASDV